MTSNSEIRQLERTLSTLLNKQLQLICQQNQLKTGGVKAELQNRIKNALIENYNSCPQYFRRIQASIHNIVRGPSGPNSQPTMPPSFQNGGNYNYNPPAQQFTRASNTAQPLGSYGSSSTAGANNMYHIKNSSQGFRDLQFKPSPFYSITSRIGDIKTCDVMTQHRNTIHLSIRVGEHPNLASLGNDKSYRVMMFCAADNNSIQDIAFPHQSEFKVNGGEVKANLRGLKGKPGTTRPVDITGSLRLKPPTYNNNIEFTYALTNKVKKHNPSPAATKFYLAAYLLNRKANDPDVVATSTVLSLKCPLSYMRLRTPCRSILCLHIQCFDADSYLQLQEQGPQWVCPICNQSAPFENLAVDEYVKDILESTTDSTEQVTIEPNGVWSTQLTEAAPKKSRASNANTSIDVEDDISVVTDNPSYGNRGTPHYATPIRSLMSGETPNSGSREPSGAPRSGGGTKRPATEVIDLTLDSDEDDAPLLRPPKKLRGAFEM
ncbi:hypothetical protein GQX73_g7785 [Xylaria multiplex]|uniref:SP-RING-type domain-containing protein n=1 Tax=Xylaria multiplex TaxID=323545 RepID=A0A7C8INP2_9PEZI|nr:hypothetical protein GQX73_g7785 [Xylaria multiplex]